MSDIKDHGGPAFPTKYRIDPVQMPAEGMTLRDYFAVHASDEDIADIMAGMPATERVIDNLMGGKRIIRALPEYARQIARYMHADAMLKERAK